MIVYPRMIGFDPDYDWQLDFRLPMHAPMPTRPQMLDEAEADSGLLTAFEFSLWSELEFETWRIPGTGAAGITGWYGALGVAEFLVQARRKRPFRLILDRDTPAVFRVVQLVSAEESREPLKVQAYRVHWRVRAMDGVAFEI